MKKSITLLLTAALLVTALAGCGGSTAFKPASGTWSGDTYTNDSIGLVFNKPENWVVATEEEMAQIMGIGLEVMQEATGTQYSEKMLELQTIYDLYASDPATGASVLLMFENLTLSGSKDIKTEDYVTAFTGQMEQTGMYSDFESGEMTLAGETYATVTATMEMMGVSISQTTLLRKFDSYMLVITATAMPEIDASTLLASFSAK